MPGGFGGYPYWIVFTPFPKGNDRLENPTIRASHDGMYWQRVPEMAEPLVPAPKTLGLHHADPEIVYNLGRLHLVYLTICNGSNEVTFKTMNCQDDFHWSKPRIIHEDVGAVSPTFSVEGNMWYVWFIRMKWTTNGQPRSSLVCREGSDLTSLKNERQCCLRIPNHVPWHVDIQKVEQGYEAMIAAFPNGTDISRTRLFHLISEDGLSFNLSQRNPIIAPSSFGWDNRGIYRSCFLKDPYKNYRIWYSASSWGRHWGIGLLQGSLDSLRETDAPLVSLPSNFLRFPREIAERLKYEARHHFPSFFLRRFKDGK